jgi:hypothetical protein
VARCRRDGASFRSQSTFSGAPGLDVPKLRAAWTFVGCRIATKVDFSLSLS